MSEQTERKGEEDVNDHELDDRRTGGYGCIRNIFFDRIHAALQSRVGEKRK